MNREPSPVGQGVEAFLRDVERLAAQFALGTQGTREFVLAMGDRYAFIRLGDAWNLPRFLRQMAGVPPMRFGVAGFRRSLVDDKDPARHYTAFVFVGYWLPRWLAILVLWLWELAGYVRYRRRWSEADMRMGYVGLWHGALVRRYGHTVLPSLIARDLAQGKEWGHINDEKRQM